MAKQKAAKEAVTSEKIQEIIPVIASRLNRGEDSAEALSEELGVSPKMINRIAQLLRRSGKDVPKVKFGLKAAVEKYAKGEAVAA